MESGFSREFFQHYVREWIERQDSLESVSEVNTIPESTLSQLGCDSLSMVDLAQSLKRELGVTVPATALTNTATVAQTADLIVEYALEVDSGGKAR